MIRTHRAGRRRRRRRRKKRKRGEKEEKKQQRIDQHHYRRHRHTRSSHHLASRSDHLLTFISYILSLFLILFLFFCFRLHCLLRCRRRRLLLSSSTISSTINLLVFLPITNSIRLSTISSKISLI